MKRSSQIVREGIKQKRLAKWHFYAVVAEKFMSYIDKDETSAVFSDMSGILQEDYQPRTIPKDFDTNIHIVLRAQWKNRLGIM